MKRHFKTKVEICILGVIKYFLVLDLTQTVQRKLEGLPTVLCQHQIVTFCQKGTRAQTFSTTFPVSVFPLILYSMFKPMK